MNLKNILIIIFSIFLFAACGSGSERSSQAACSDMTSYDKGVDARKNAERGANVTGRTVYNSDCNEVQNSMYYNTDKECFCKGWRS